MKDKKFTRVGDKTGAFYAGWRLPRICPGWLARLHYRETARGRTEAAEKDCAEAGAGERDKTGLIETEV